MKLIKPGRKVVPDSIIVTCQKFNGRGCGAVMEITPEDCFYTNSPENVCLNDPLSFFCESCGLMLTPASDLMDPKDSLTQREREELSPDTGMNRWPVKIKNGPLANVPPWACNKKIFKHIDDFCAQHRSDWGIR